MQIEHCTTARSMPTVRRVPDPLCGMHASARWRVAALGVTLVSVVACASPAGGVPDAGTATPSTAVRSTTSGSAIVQVREFPSSRTVSVLAWSPKETAYGLRAEITRQGVLVGADQGHHQLYLSTTYVNHRGGFTRAAEVPGTVLVRTGVGRDNQACSVPDHCSPRETVGVRLTDGFLRRNRDELVLTFYPEAEANWTISIDRGLVDAYLATVDSVRAALRAK